MRDQADIRYVDSTEALRDLCRDVAGQPWLALDTEFMREQTYYPRLCLLQIGTPDGMVACVDPLALPQLDPLLDLIYDPAVTKVFHACHQDMEIFFHLRAALPGPIFDTQVAAPLLGLPAQASYARLVEDVLGEHLEKDQTRTDWSRRPLTAGQLAYAADDVFFLGRLYPVLRERLAAQNRLDWLEEDFASACMPARYDNPPEEAWRRIRGTQRMTGQQLAILRSLAGWRETTARRRDRPRGWLLRDEALIELACRAPADTTRLEQVHGVGAQTVTRYGTELLAVIAEGQRAPELPAARGRPLPLSSAEEALFERLSEAARGEAERQGLDPTVLASRNDLVDFIRNRPASRILQGWRRHAVGATLLAATAGQETAG